MTDRLAEISARIDGVEKLGSVVNAMRGIAAARSRQAQAELVAVDGYAGAIRSAIGRILPMVPPSNAASKTEQRRAIVVFLAEEGFVANFSEKILEVLFRTPRPEVLFMVGTRGCALARERGLAPAWQAAMPARTQSIPKLSDQLAARIYQDVANGSIDELGVLHATVGEAGVIETLQAPLLPFDSSAMRDGSDGEPLLQIAPADLLTKLAGEYLHAQLCQAALHAFVAENQARMQAMARTHGQVDRMLEMLKVRQRIVRQDEITAEIIELAAGETANREAARHGR